MFHHSGEEVASGEGANDLRSLIQAGDIVVRRDASDSSGHTCIVARVDGDNVYVYDCGSRDNWSYEHAHGGEAIRKTKFFTSDTHKKGKWRIIRVKPL